ncbi:MAG: hypothetical protein JSS87_04530 [Acidobacteria bacterium]|nr:hypothetical protein [Acidobacteriota bacterium]
MMTGKKLDDEFSTDTIATLIFGGVILLVTLVLCFKLGSGWTSGTAMLLLSMVTGMLVGWVTGILASPYSGDVAYFGKLGQALSAIFTGYIAAKASPLLDLLLQHPGAVPTEIRLRLLFGVCGFLIALIITFVSRRYAVEELKIAPVSLVHAGDSVELVASLKDLQVQGVRWICEDPECAVDERLGIFKAPEKVAAARNVVVVAYDPKRPEVRGSLKVPIA